MLRKPTLLLVALLACSEKGQQFLRVVVDQACGARCALASMIVVERTSTDRLKDDDGACEVTLGARLDNNVLLRPRSVEE